LPDPLFNDPQSTVVFDADGGLLGARIAQDGQWRFGTLDSLPKNYIDCVIQFEDRHFRHHPGVDILALFRALIQNFSAGEVISGGSTLSMQTVRMARGNRKRSIWQKLIEMHWAIRLEVWNTKAEIMQLYAAHAPFGGNVVGLEAAAWRYFGRPPTQLSWAETATLAVLPNAPALIHPGRNREALKKKRDRLLNRLVEKGVLDSLTASLALEEMLPQKPLPLPQRAPHWVDYHDQKSGGRIESEIIPWLQDMGLSVIEKHYGIQSANGVHNLAALVLDNESREVLAYLGNSSPPNRQAHGAFVDVIHRPRSSGSILKPLLFEAMLEAGELLPQTLVPDIPTVYRGYKPENFTQEFDGAVHADEALIRSLNVPAVRLLHQYGVLRFYDQLKDMGFTTFHRPAEEYGLSLILGGAEVNLWELCQVYSDWARQPGPAEYLTLEAMKQVKRPESEFGWQQFQSAQIIAWKTGTSFGYRDAWAIGVTPTYTVGVWVGNADGEGRPGLTGLSAAAPVLFDFFNLLPEEGWFEEPEAGLKSVTICRESGMKASDRCPHQDTIWIPPAGLQTRPCPYHVNVLLDETLQYRVNADCYPVGKIQKGQWFILPPAMAGFYKAKDPRYRELPPWSPDCSPLESELAFEILYPPVGEAIYLPIDEQGLRQQAVFELVHNRRNAKIFWFLNNKYLGSTTTIHKLAISAEPGQHRLSLSDDQGQELTRFFTIK